MNKDKTQFNVYNLNESKVNIPVLITHKNPEECFKIMYKEHYVLGKNESFLLKKVHSNAIHA